jgi:hypothetical protein
MNGYIIFPFSTIPGEVDITSGRTIVVDPNNPYAKTIDIKNSQDPDTKSFIQYHIEKHRQKMADLSNFILAVTPKVPYLPQRDFHEKLTEK